jgi:ACS family hexuronate transporter-like MFS transporter
MARVLPPAARPRGFGMLFTGSSIGITIAAPFASLVFRHAGWRATFLVTAGAGLAWVPLWLFVTGRPAVREALDRRTARAARPPLRAVLNGRMLRAMLAIFAIAPVSGFILTWGAKYLQAAFGVEQGDIGDYLWLPPIALDVGALGFGDLLARLHRPRELFVLALLLGTGIALLPMAGTPWQAVAVFALGMAGTGGMYTIATSQLLTAVPAEQVSFAGGTVAMAQSIALIIATPIMGALVDRGQHLPPTAHDLGSVATGLGVWVLPGATAWILWRNRKPEGT